MTLCSDYDFNNEINIFNLVTRDFCLTLSWSSHDQTIQIILVLTNFNNNYNNQSMYTLIIT